MTIRRVSLSCNQTVYVIWKNENICWFICRKDVLQWCYTDEEYKFKKQTVIKV